VERAARRPRRLVPRHRRPARHPDADGVRVFQGTENGSLATEPRGTSGFGYDAIFIPGSDSSHRTYAQMTSQEKNKISHRKRAVQAMRNDLGLQ
jgi:XTP/dITP diphosphohydrolase